MSPVLVPFATAFLASTKKRFKIFDRVYPERRNHHPVGTKSSRELYGVQLEVIGLLLEAERRKLDVLQRELQVVAIDYDDRDGCLKAKHDQKQQLLVAITRIQAQYDHLDKEYREKAFDAIISANTRPPGKGNRSQPAIGLKHKPKPRPTIFGTVATDPTLTTHKSNEESSLRKHEQHTSLSPNLSSNMKNSVNHTQNALVYRDGNLVSGSIDALVQHMMPNDHYYPDRAYLFAFLLSCRLYIKPHDLIGHVSDLCPIKKSPNLADSLIRWLADWTETFPYDFRDERIMHYVRNITQDCINVKSSLRKNVSSLLHNLLQRLTALENYEKHVANLQRQMLEDKPHMFDMSIVCTSPGTLAEQLTIIELEKLSFIGPEEFVQAFAKENPSLETEFKDLKKTRNLEHYIQWFNRLSYFVASQVCKHPKKKQRVKVIEFWIEVARECFNIGNFNSLMSIIAGLNMSPVSRLKKTWSKINSAKFTILEHQMDPTGNFSCYRSTLKAAMWRSAGATDQRQRIVIPFFSLLVKDLYFLNEGCCNKLENGHINFEKFWQLAKQVTEFMAWKEVTCPFNRIEFLSQNLQAADVMNEQELSLASFQCEPPDNTSERDRLKSLKVESLQNSSLSSASSTTTTV